MKMGRDDKSARQYSSRRAAHEVLTSRGMKNIERKIVAWKTAVDMRARKITGGVQCRHFPVAWHTLQSNKYAVPAVPLKA